PHIYSTSLHDALPIYHRMHSLQKLSNWRENPSPFHQYATVEGTIQTAYPFNGFILIGLFSKPIPEEFPLYGTLLSSTGNFSFMRSEEHTSELQSRFDL